MPPRIVNLSASKVISIKAERQADESRIQKQNPISAFAHDILTGQLPAHELPGFIAYCISKVALPVGLACIGIAIGGSIMVFVQVFLMR